MLLSFVAAFLFAGAVVIADNDGVGSPTSRVSRIEKNDSTEERQATLFPADGKFLASLRFWERNKKQTQHDSSTVSDNFQPSQGLPSEVPNAPVVQSSIPITSSLATDSAPEPPPYPFVDNRHDELGDAPLPRRSANVDYNPGNGNTPLPQETKQRTTSHVSYSFDSRDWVEFFPAQQEQDRVRAESTPDKIATVTQKTSLRLSESNEPQNLDNADDWDGHATVLIAHRQREPLQTTVATVSESISVKKPQIDLSPSYQKRLPHVQTCGVVVVQANFPLTEIATILDEINLLQNDLNSYIGVPEPQEKIELCLFKDEDSYTRFLKEFFPRAPLDRRALYVKLDNRPGTLMVQKTKDFEIDLRHEMTHAIMHASIPTVPIWLDEGLAKYFEVPPNDRASKNPYMSEIRRNVRFGTVPSLDRLTKLETIDDMGVKEYRDSWAWTHFLIRRSPETHRLLAAYLQMLAVWTPKDTKTGSVSYGFFGTIFRDSAKRETVPSLKLYLDDVMPNQREAFKEHFSFVAEKQ